MGFKKIITVKRGRSRKLYLDDIKSVYTMDKRMLPPVPRFQDKNQAT